MTGLFLTALAAILDPTAATPAPAPVTAKPDKMLCRYLETTGSRVAGRRVCMPKSEWNRVATRTSDEVSNAIGRINPYSKVP